MTRIFFARLICCWYLVSSNPEASDDGFEFRVGNRFFGAVESSEPVLQIFAGGSESPIRFSYAPTLDEAETLSRRALAIDERAGGKHDSMFPHHLNQFCLVLLMQDKRAEAARHNERAWRLNVSRPDVTAGRILFVRTALAMLEGSEPGFFIGQLKTLLGGSELVVGNVAPTWHVASVLDYLRTRLPAAQCELLAALVGALNERRSSAALDAFPEWADQPPVPLGPWPETRS